MSSFLTDGRAALIAALRSDATIARRVRTFFDSGPGVRRRRTLSPAACPVLGVSPAGAAVSATANVEREVVQTLQVEVATDGQDAAPCEELVALVMARVEACDESGLGLTASGLADVRTRSVTWSALPDPGAARVIWTAGVEVELLWRMI